MFGNMDVVLISAINFLPIGSVITGGAYDFSAVWTAIVNDNIIKNSTDPRLLSLPGRLKWIGGLDVLYNRPCYDDITKDVASMTHALVIGTPGIGKTLFLQIFLIHLARCAKAEGRPTPSIHYIFETEMKVVTLSLLSDGSVIDITDQRVPDPEYLLSDSVDLNVPSGTVLNLLVASATSSNYNQFEKRIGEPGALAGEAIIMPLWSFDELLCIRPHTYNHEIAQFRYHIYGGNARNFMFSERVRTRVLPIVEDTMNLVFRDAKINEFYPDEWSNIARHISTRLMSDDPSILNTMLRHMLPDREKIWASKFMELLAGAIFEDNSGDVSWVLRDKICYYGEYNNLFGSLGHRKLLMSLVPFTLKPLLNPLPIDKPVFPTAQFNLSVVLFSTISEITHLPDGTYGLPLNGKFPLVDAVVQPNMMIKFAISPTDHIGSVKNLTDICAGLHEKDLTKVKMIFVIPKDNVATFRGQEYLLVGEVAIPQYICLDDPSVVNEVNLMTVKEKQLWARTNGLEG